MVSKIKGLRLTDDDRLKAVEKVLGEPVGFDVSEPALKVKNLLLGVSIILLCMVVGGISVGKKVSFLGISLEGITAYKMVLGLSVAVFWVTGHYLWYCIELFGEWKLRVTGTRVSYQTGGTFGSAEADYPSNPKQSTLYNWWRQNSHRFRSVTSAIEQVETELKVIQSKVDSALSQVELGRPPTNLGFLENLLSAVQDLKSTNEANLEFMNSNRIVCSLKRFDTCYWRVLKSQNARVLIIDVLLPLVLGCAALGHGVWYLHINTAA